MPPPASLSLSFKVSVLTCTCQYATLSCFDSELCSAGHHVLTATSLNSTSCLLLLFMLNCKVALAYGTTVEYCRCCGGVMGRCGVSG